MLYILAVWVGHRKEEEWSGNTSPDRSLMIDWLLLLLLLLRVVVLAHRSPQMDEPPDMTSAP